MKKRPGAISVVALALALLTIAAPSAADDAEKRKAAIEKAIKYLREKQQPDGTWTYENLHPRLKAYPMLQGSTALGAFALLKAGVPPTDPAVKKACAFVVAQPIEHVYSAGLVLLLLDARLHWEPPVEPGTTTTEKKKARLDPKDAALGQAAVAFLEKTQQTALWRYPSTRKGEDSSNAQYALLGLDAAERMGLAVPKEIYVKAQAFYVANQEKDGPDVPAFSVPGADLSIAELRAVEKETRERLEKIQKTFKGKKPGDTDPDGRLKEDLVRQAEEDAAKKVFKTAEKLAKMKARGFPYAPAAVAADDERKIYGSMTASGVACLFICKAHLDGTAHWAPIGKAVDQAIRDGCAWLSQKWTADENPNYSYHHYYWLYSLERAAILNLVPRFGKHDWYKDGCDHLVKKQHPDGSFYAGTHTTVGPVVDTCFGLLFLARGTTPIVRLPDRIVTGGGK